MINNLQINKCEDLNNQDYINIPEMSFNLNVLENSEGVLSFLDGDISKPSESKILRDSKGRFLKINKNILIFCKCGCGNKLWKYDNHRRKRKYIYGHINNIYKGKFKYDRTIMIPCKCGCGKLLLKYHPKWRTEREYIFGHKMKKIKENPIIECACGCGIKLLKYKIYYNNKGCPCYLERKYIYGHQRIGIHHSEKGKINISNGKKGKTWEEIYGIEGARNKRDILKKIGYNNNGKKRSEESIKKRNETRKIRIAEGKIIHPMLGKYHTNKSKLKNRLAKLKQWADPNSIYNTKEYREKNIKASIKGLMKRPTSFEKFIIDLCLKYNFTFIYTGDGRVLINYKNPDFLDENNKIVIEVFFSYFKIRDYGSVEQYKEFCRKKYNSAGYKVLFLDENDIKGEEIKVVEKIREVYNEKNINII